MLHLPLSSHFFQNTDVFPISVVVLCYRKEYDHLQCDNLNILCILVQISLECDMMGLGKSSEDWEGLSIGKNGDANLFSIGTQCNLLSLVQCLAILAISKEM